MAIAPASQRRNAACLSLSSYQLFSCPNAEETSDIRISTIQSQAGGFGTALCQKDFVSTYFSRDSSACADFMLAYSINRSQATRLKTLTAAIVQRARKQAGTNSCLKWYTARSFVFLGIQIAFTTSLSLFISLINWTALKSAWHYTHQNVDRKSHSQIRAFMAPRCVSARTIAAVLLLQDIQLCWK